MIRWRRRVSHHRGPTRLVVAVEPPPERSPAPLLAPLCWRTTAALLLRAGARRPRGAVEVKQRSRKDDEDGKIFGSASPARRASAEVAIY
jgi:hypothetical protein